CARDRGYYALDYW
nr:immunoglobulin heavy chain junction region [Mus musculus]NSM04649.1 immunoglobulin heavy chain junction region [Mus musculus]NSM05078.1 immunoglobulin heavy chain junction region [Mus musculus]NSM06829.1 immunoglobulin heavy chain junction region [Mus musculus]NSM07873.1 immunoglobulin heavy chain junction region [Mus musculus]